MRDGGRKSGDVDSSGGVGLFVLLDLLMLGQWAIAKVDVLYGMNICVCQLTR